MINDYIIEDQFYRVTTTSGKSFIIDISDYDLSIKISWHIDSLGYVSGNFNGKTTRFHRYILNAKHGEYVDHINHDKLDNRRSNLRLCTNAENCRNAKLSKNNKTGFIGVKWDYERKKWQSNIMVNRKGLFLGRYDDIQDAIKARLLAEKKYFGEFSPQKHLFSDYGIEV